MNIPDDRDERRALVALSLVPGVGPGRIRKLVDRFGSAAAALASPAATLATVWGIGDRIARAIAKLDVDANVDRQFVRAAHVGATLTTAWDLQYPVLLRQLYAPPSFLWSLGEYSASDARAVAVVGTRRPTEYGRSMARRLGGELARSGYTIVSGLAYGIDAVAHRAALEAGGRTLAVLGSGIDRIYPERHNALARQIAAQGVVVSEFALGAAPDAPNFPRRNRIISGLSLGVVVIEAYEQGGALITARLAVEQNREVFAVPSGANSPAGAGTNLLIRDGHAKLVQSVDDILVELDASSATTAAAREVAQAVDLEPVEKTLHDAIQIDPLHIDDICLRTGLDMSDALVGLLGLEMKGLVAQRAGMRFVRR